MITSSEYRTAHKKCLSIWYHIFKANLKYHILYITYRKLNNKFIISRLNPKNS